MLSLYFVTHLLLFHKLHVRNCAAFGCIFDTCCFSILHCYLRVLLQGALSSKSNVDVSTWNTLIHEVSYETVNNHKNYVVVII